MAGGISMALLVMAILDVGVQVFILEPAFTTIGSFQKLEMNQQSIHVSNFCYYFYEIKKMKIFFSFFRSTGQNNQHKFPYLFVRVIS
jgi:hypothetical protein